MNYQQHPIVPNANFGNTPADPIYLPQNQFTYNAQWDFQQQHNPQMVQVVLPFPPQVVLPFPPQIQRPVYPLSGMADNGVPLSRPMPDQSTSLTTMNHGVPLPPMPNQNASLPAMTERLSLTPTGMHSPQSNPPIFLFSPPAFNQQSLSLPHFSNMHRGMVSSEPQQFFAPAPFSTPSPPNAQQFFAPSPHGTPSPPNEEAIQWNSRTSPSPHGTPSPQPYFAPSHGTPSPTPPGFENQRYNTHPPPRQRKPLPARADNSRENARRRNSKRKNKKPTNHSHFFAEYRPSYRSKQDMIDQVYRTLSRKYAALGLLAKEGLRGDDTIRVHVKNFKALTEIEEALVAVESHPKVIISQISLPFSFRNELQKKGFLVYLKLEDATMVPHAQAVFRQFDMFKKCGVMRETGQYVESLPLTQPSIPTSPSPFFSLHATTQWETHKEPIPDASSTESIRASTAELAETDSEHLANKQPVISQSFGPLTALASTRKSMSRQASRNTNHFTIRTLMRSARRTRNGGA